MEPAQVLLEVVREFLRLEQALHARPRSNDDLVHHSDLGVQYLSIRYTERLAEAGIERSVGSVGDSYDNALAETIIGLFKTEVIRQQGPWRNIEAVEFAVLKWVHWFNERRLLEPLGYMPPAEFEEQYYRNAAPAEEAVPEPVPVPEEIVLPEEVVAGLGASWHEQEAAENIPVTTTALTHD